MPDNPSPMNQTISLSAAERHDHLCDDFQKAWNEGKKPRIEDYLQRVPLDEQPALLCSLAKVEKDLREDDQILDEFRQRFPQFGLFIETVFGNKTGADTLELPAPEIPGHRIVERIAYGGMGVVYKAHELDLDRTVALKMVRGSGWVDKEDLNRFEIEAKAVAGIEHPNIVRIYSFGRYQQLPYYTMEFVDGGSLQGHLSGEPMPPRRAAELLETCCRAMQVVHERNFIHRDLKPGNILLTKGGTPKISDFGLAKRLGNNLSVTVTGTIMGTASYMAPEQARGEKHLTTAVDIYALGAVLYECLAGRPPFRFDSYEQTIRSVIEMEPQRLREIDPEIPAELEAICLKCLDKDPTRRYARASDIAEDLRRFLAGEAISIGSFDVIDQHARWARKLGYEDLEVLGCMQWAFVYKAREVRINRQVILKLSTDPVGSPAHARLLRQAEAMGDLLHPNLEQLHYYGEQSGQPYLVQECVVGRSLSAVMRERTTEESEKSEVDNDPSREVAVVRLPPRGAFSPVVPAYVAEWGRTLARALQFIHDRGVLHSAIHPGEIRLTSEGVLKLGGFGAAQKVDPKKGPGEARATWVRPNYQPPEHLSENWKELSRCSDVYSLGAVLYELLTGQTPFFGLALPETREAVLKTMPVAPRNINPKIPHFLDWICQRCLSKNPEERFATAAELADALDRYLRGLESSDEETANIDPEPDSALPPTSDYELRIYHKNQSKPTVYPLPRRWVTIGRAVESDIVVQDDFCSRQHCAIYWDENSSQHVLIIIRAKHGLEINRVKFNQGSQALVPGDVIQVASSRFVFDRKTLGR